MPRPADSRTRIAWSRPRDGGLTWEGEDGELADRLLPGEPITSTFPDDAAHWVAVYGELIRFLTESSLDAPDALGRYQRRIEFWRRRVDAPSPDESLDGGQSRSRHEST